MATLYVAEYSQTKRVEGRDVAQIADEGSLQTEQSVAIAASSTQSAAFSVATHLVRVHTDSICSIAFGSNPTAATTKKRMAADQTEYFGVAPGTKIAVIANS